MREYRLSELYDNVSTNSLSRALLYENGDVLNLHYGDIHLKYSGVLDISKAELPFALTTDYKFKESSRMETGDVIFADAAEDYEGIGKAVEIGETDTTPSYAGLHTIHLKRKTDSLASGYMGYLSQAYAFRRKVWFIAQGAKVLGISSKELLKQSISIPNIAEQTTIVNRLKAVDQKINLLTKKKEALETYKKGLMQKIFSQELRFKREDGTDYPEWEVKKGDELFRNISDKNHNGDLPILAITQNYGAIPREMINYEISVEAKSILSYKVVEQGDFIISLRSFQGGIEYSNYRGICSPAYIILRPTQIIEDSFYMAYLKTHNVIQQINSRLEGIRDGKMLSYKYFSELNLPYPSIAEQERIGNFLSTIEQSILVTQKLLDENVNIKKGLLQQMFV